MKKSLLFLFGFIFVSGCATLPEQPGARERTHLKDVSVGMSRTEVADRLGKQMIIGYELDQDQSRFVPSTLKNPTRAEILRAGDKTYQIIFYFTSVKHPDGIITDDELTPFVFDAERLVGQGWSFLDHLREKYRLSSPLPRGS